MCLLRVSDSAFCAGVARADQSKDLLGNPSETKELPERPPLYRIEGLTKVHVCHKKDLVELPSTLDQDSNTKDSVDC